MGTFYLLLSTYISPGPFLSYFAFTLHPQLPLNLLHVH